MKVQERESEEIPRSLQLGPRSGQPEVAEQDQQLLVTFVTIDLLLPLIVVPVEEAGLLSALWSSVGLVEWLDGVEAGKQSDLDFFREGLRFVPESDLLLPRSKKHYLVLVELQDHEHLPIWR